MQRHASPYLLKISSIIYGIMRKTKTHRKKTDCCRLDCPCVKMEGIYSPCFPHTRFCVCRTGTDRLALQEAVLHHSETAVWGAILWSKMLFPLTQYTAESIMDVTLHHLQRQISSVVICCAMFSYPSSNGHSLEQGITRNYKTFQHWGNY